MPDPNSYFISKLLLSVNEEIGYKEAKELFRFASICSMAQSGYNVYLAHEAPIESLPATEKQKLWNESAEVYSDKKKRAEWCKAVYFLNELVKEEK